MCTVLESVSGIGMMWCIIFSLEATAMLVFFSKANVNVLPAWCSTKIVVRWPTSTLPTESREVMDRSKIALR